MKNLLILYIVLIIFQLQFCQIATVDDIHLSKLQQKKNICQVI